MENDENADRQPFDLGTGRADCENRECGQGELGRRQQIRQQILGGIDRDSSDGGDGARGERQNNSGGTGSNAVYRK